jgi:hypothetical protein
MKRQLQRAGIFRRSPSTPARRIAPPWRERKKKPREIGAWRHSRDDRICKSAPTWTRTKNLLIKSDTIIAIFPRIFDGFVPNFFPS